MLRVIAQDQRDLLLYQLAQTFDCCPTFAEVSRCAYQWYYVPIRSDLIEHKEKVLAAAQRQFRIDGRYPDWLVRVYDLRCNGATAEDGVSIPPPAS